MIFKDFLIDYRFLYRLLQRLHSSVGSPWSSHNINLRLPRAIEVEFRLFASWYKIDVWLHPSSMLVPPLFVFSSLKNIENAHMDVTQNIDWKNAINALLWVDNNSHPLPPSLPVCLNTFINVTLNVKKNSLMSFEMLMYAFKVKLQYFFCRNSYCTFRYKEAFFLYSISYFLISYRNCKWRCYNNLNSNLKY